MSAVDVDQDEVLRRRLDRGERLIGVALSRAPCPGPGQGARAWPLTGWTPPLTAWLTDAMILAPGRPVPPDGLDRPQAAPGIVAVLGEGLAGPRVTVADALAAIDSVRAGVVIAQAQGTEPGAASAGRAPAPPARAATRPHPPGTRPDRAGAPPDRAGAPSEAIGDNGSLRYLVTGPVTRPAAGLDLTLEACLVEVDGQVADSATGAAVAGHPAVALAAAANDLALGGNGLEPGWVVFTGGMAGPVQLRPAGALGLHFTNLGSIFLPGG